MKNIRKEVALWVQLISFTLIWVTLVAVARNGLKIDWEAVYKLPHAVTLYVVLSLLFTRWLWRLPVFRGWLVPFPDLQGTWDGHLKSTWKSPATGQTLQPIPAILVIRQSFSTVSCTLFTQESESYSTAAQLSQDEDGGPLHLNYNYANRSKATIRDRSPIHDGAARLRVVSAPERSLEGEYWTGRCTTGEMVFKFKGKELRESFPAAGPPVEDGQTR
jgi:hypothetical protein